MKRLVEKTQGVSDQPTAQKSRALPTCAYHREQKSHPAKLQTVNTNKQLVFKSLIWRMICYTAS